MNRIKNIRILASLIVLSLILTNCGREINLNEFPKDEFEKVIAFKMTGEYGEVIENGKISDKVTGKGKQLEDKEVEELLNIFTDKSTYGEEVASCFEPHVGYVFYGEKNKIVGHSTICLACNWMKTSPNIGEFIFSKKGAKRLAKIEREIFKK